MATMGDDAMLVGRRELVRILGTNEVVRVVNGFQIEDDVAHVFSLISCPLLFLKFL
jgi:hypothetical protein